MGCAPAPAAPAPAGFTADTATRDGLISGASASEAGCRALPDGVWVVAGTRRECLRAISAGLGTAAPSVLVFLSGDPPGATYAWSAGETRMDLADMGSAPPARNGSATAEALKEATGGPAILLARPGLHGASGNHGRDRFTRAEVDLIDAALSELRTRHAIQRFAIIGFSGGGAVLANLLGQRSDIGCAVIASAPLDLAEFHQTPRDAALADSYLLRGDLADPMARAGTLRSAAEVIVLGDPRDRVVAPAGWRRWAAAAGRAGLRVRLLDAAADDESRHDTVAPAIAAAVACLGEPG